MYLSIAKLKFIQVCVVFHQPRPYLVVVGFTVRQALPLVMAMSEKRFLTLGTNKMLKESALGLTWIAMFYLHSEAKPQS